MKVYIAGPMTGIPHFNIPEFDRLAGRLRRAGHEVVSPAELDDKADRDAAYASPDGGDVHYKNGKTWGDFLARDVKLISDGAFDAIVVLPGWSRSRGARLETFVGAALCGLSVYGEHNGVLYGTPLLDLYRAWCADPLLVRHAEMEYARVTS